jgi:hypothetical protein
MFTSRAVRALVGLTFLQCFSACVWGAESDALTFTGRVLLADGSPAAGAIIERQGTNQYKTFATHADADGRFQTTARFENGVNLHVRTADGSQQAIYALSPPSVRVTVRKPLEIKLRLASPQKVSVSAANNPVVDAQVIVTGHGFTARAKTDTAGQAAVRIPAGALLKSVAAFHPTLGVGGEYFDEKSEQKETYPIELLPPAPHEVHLVDDEDRPIPNFDLGVAVSVGNHEHIIVSPLEESHARTNDAGVAKFTWIPRDHLRYLSPQLWDDEWKGDALNLDRMKEGITTQKLRRKFPVAGRIVLPEGIDPTGILISGMGFGTGNHVDLPSARAAADGTFTLMVASSHSFVVGILDSEWACDPWTGDLLTDGDSKQVQIELKLYPATPVTLHVTRGSDRRPLANTFVQFETRRNFKYTGDNGKRGNASGAVRCWLKTDADGTARVGVGHGEHKFRLSAGEWAEEHVVDVKTADPIEVAFHRPWIGMRKITGVLLDAGQPFAPSEAATIIAWTDRSPYLSLQHSARLLENGKFELEFDAEQASLLFLDPKQKKCGSFEIDLQTTSITLPLRSTATYGGTVVDQTGEALTDHEIYLAPKENISTSIVTYQLNAKGQFHWDAVPSQTPLRLFVRAAPANSNYYFRSDERYFEPDEVREGDKLRAREFDRQPTQTLAVAEVPLAETLPRICRDAKLSAMRALVLLSGDDAESTRNLASRLQDYEECPGVLSYRLSSLAPERQKQEAAMIADRKWPTPEPGEVVLLVLDDSQKVTAQMRLNANQRDTAFSEGRQFLSQHKPPQRDAIALLTAACKEAKANGKRIWLVSGGPLCGPCFMLSRWMDDQHALLEKDYVLLKIMGGLDKNADDIAKFLPGSKSSGIPYFSIMEPDGKVLITSKGPLGNVGMPTEPEDIRHVKRMLEQTAQRLSPAEITTLEASLAPK